MKIFSTLTCNEKYYRIIVQGYLRRRINLEKFRGDELSCCGRVPRTHYDFYHFHASNFDQFRSAFDSKLAKKSSVGTQGKSQIAQERANERRSLRVCRRHHMYFLKNVSMVCVVEVGGQGIKFQSSTGFLKFPQNLEFLLYLYITTAQRSIK